MKEGGIWVSVSVLQKRSRTPSERFRDNKHGIESVTLFASFPDDSMITFTSLSGPLLWDFSDAARHGSSPQKLEGTI